MSGLHTINEEWFLPNGTKQEGQLVEDHEAGTITLEIYGKHYIEGAEIGDNFRTNPLRYHQVILGGTSQPYTLYNCEIAGAQKIGRNLYKVKYKVQFVLYGLHVKMQPLRVKAGTFMYPNLSSWYDGSDLLNKLKGRQGVYVDGKHQPQSVLRNDVVNINDNLDLVLEDEVSDSYVEMSVRSQTVYTKSITFRYNTEVDFEQMLHDAVVFKKLLAFTHGKPISHKITSIELDIAHKTKDSAWVDGDARSFFPLIRNFSLHKNKKIHKESAHSSHMIFSRWNCTTDELKEIIKTWFQNERFYNIYEYYLDSNNWFEGKDVLLSNVMFNNRFLNLVQGLEDFYREYCQGQIIDDTTSNFRSKKQRALSMIKDAELKKWVNDNLNPKFHTSLSQKLQKLLEFPELIEVFKHVTFDTFVSKVKSYRDKLSHGMEKEITQEEQFHRYFFICQCLLCFCILKSLNVPDIPKKLDSNLKFRDNIWQILSLQKTDNDGGSKS